jgi:hypothetical protein
VCRRRCCPTSGWCSRSAHEPARAHRAAGLRARRVACRPTETWSGPYNDRIPAIDCDNTAWLRAQLKEIRWFDIPTYGAEADAAAWHLVQHADRESDFQRTMLEQLRSLAVEATSQKNLAYLWDRVALRRASAALRHTRILSACPPACRTGGWQPHPTKDSGHLDERRAAAGMSPISGAIEANRAACLQPQK